MEEVVEGLAGSQNERESLTGCASVQVSNWFANARRRLKNTVRQPDLSWALRIKLYNNYIQGNAERLSMCSDDTDTDGTSSE